MLQPQQERVINKLKQEDKLLVYHGMGSGKTLTSIAAAKQLQLPLTMVGPASLRSNLPKEMQKHKIKPKASFHSYHKPPSQAEAKDSLLVFDEAHNMGQEGTKRSKYPQELSGKKTVFLTGTPIRNRPEELVPLMRGLGIEGVNSKNFRDQFVKEKKVGRIKAFLLRQKPGVKYEIKNERRLEKLFKGKVDYHQPSQDQDFPQVVEQVQKVPMSKSQRAIYKEFERGKPSLAYRVKWGLPPGKSESSSLNSFLAASRQISNSPRNYTLKELPLSELPKVQQIIKDIEQRATSDKNYRGVTYSNYLDSGVNLVKQELDKKKIPSAVFSGQLSAKEKEEIIQQYNKGKLKHLLVTSAGGEGLDLKGTKLLQVMEPHWNEPKLDQVKARAIRYKSHEHLPADERKVELKTYISTRPRKVKLLPKQLTADEYLLNMAKEKQDFNKQYLKVLQKASES